ncbi:MAG: SOS response-associated peptidase, partial [Gammaproteobacteria bacterium]|nr:SOS response-associated peptidase [Gammaproteobacteria bacterium]
SLRDKPAYRDAFRKRRCLIPTTGFYEWHETAHGKQPYFIGGREKQLFAFAGLWEYWEGEHTLNSFTIVTTIANKMIASIHERMPVILAPADYQRWLEVENQTEDELDDLLMPVDLDWLELYPVDTAVNSPRHDSADLLERKADLFR